MRVLPSLLAALVLFTQGGTPAASAQTWERVQGLPSAASVAFNDQNPNTVWFGTDAGRLFVSHDGGRSARPAGTLPSGPLPSGIVTALFVHPSDTTFMLAGSTTGAFLSRDGGQTWAPALPDRNVFLNGLSVAVEPGRPDTLYVALFANNDTPGANFFRSFDRGHTWERHSIPVGSPNGGFCSVATRGDGVLLAGSAVGGGIFRSADYGETWTRVYAEGQSGGYDVPRAVFDPSDPSVAWAAVFGFTQRGYVVRSGDGGLTWSRVTGPADVNPWAVDVDGAGRAYVGSWTTGGSGAYRSKDAGASWTHLPLTPSPSAPPVAWMIRWDPATDVVLLADGQAGAWRLEEDGTAGEGAPPAPALALSAPTPNPTPGAVSLTLTLPVGQAVRAEVFDVLGRRVAVLHGGPLAAGSHTLSLDASLLRSGAYLVRVAAGRTVATRRFTVIR